MSKHPPLFLDIFDAEGDRVAACANGEEAGALIAFLGDGAKIKFRDITVWHEGSEVCPAGESYDQVVETIVDRLQEHPEFKRLAREAQDEEYN